MAVVKSRIVVLVIGGVKRRARLVARGLRGWKGPLLVLVAIVCFLVATSPRIVPGWILFLENLRWEFVDGDDNDDEEPDIPWTNIPEGEDEDGKNCPCGWSLSEALTSGRECRGSWSMGGKSWTYYLKDRKLRADWVGTGIGAMDQPLHIIYRDLCFYRWTDEETATGVKLGTEKCFSSEGEWAEDAKSVDEADFCDHSQPATVDDSLFELPENVHWFDED